jgi:hypothetical protein
MMEFTIVREFPHITLDDPRRAGAEQVSTYHQSHVYGHLVKLSRSRSCLCRSSLETDDFADLLLVILLHSSLQIAFAFAFSRHSSPHLLFILLPTTLL